MMSSRALPELRQDALADLRRWLSELDASRSRDTLSAGMLKKAFSYAEELVKASAEKFIATLPDGGAEVLGTVSAKKTRLVSGLTIGQCVQLLIILESKRQLGSGRRVISKADVALMNRITKARNAFAHGSPSALTDTLAVRQFLTDVIALAESNVIRLATAHTN